MTDNATAIILACWPNEDPFLRQLETGSAMLPMADKPMLQRVLEKLTRLGCAHIAVIHGDEPQSAEALLGNGERWGCHITHHYAADGTKPLRQVAGLLRNPENICVLATADTLPIVDPDISMPFVACRNEGANLRWSGWAAFSGHQVRVLSRTVHTAADLESLVMAAAHSNPGLALMTPCISTSGVATALESMPILFAQTTGSGSIGRRPRKAGLWVGNSCHIHPSARLHMPVFIGNNVLIGENTEIGPNAMIGDGCVVDDGSLVSNSILLAGTYAGRGLEVKHSLLAGNHLVNSALGVSVRIADPGILRNIHRSRAHHPSRYYSQRLLGLMLWLILKPLEVLLRGRCRAGRIAATTTLGRYVGATQNFCPLKANFSTTHEDIYTGVAGAWTNHFLATFLPGLRDAVSGHVALVGLQPRTVEAILSLPEYWQRLYRNGLTGLIGESLLLGQEGASAEMRFAGDALSSGSLPFTRLLRVLGIYAGRIFAEVSSRKPNALDSVR